MLLLYSLSAIMSSVGWLTLAPILDKIVFAYNL